MLSGASKKKLQPNSVSARVVNTVMTSSSVGFSGALPSRSHRMKSTLAPSERPIQLACCCFTRSGQPSS